MTKILLNDKESVTIQMNHDPSMHPYSITIIRRGNFLGVREFSPENNDFKGKHKMDECAEVICREARARGFKISGKFDLEKIDKNER